MASSGVKGDFSKLVKLQRAFSEMAGEGFKKRIYEALEGEARDLIDQGFDAMAAPDGAPWDAREKPRPWPLLDKTGKLRRGFRVEVTGKGLRVTNSAPYGGFLQRGTKRGLPSRRMVPGRRGLGPVWRRRFRSTMNRVMRAHFKR
jgi:hypothetical protein